jgi:hypothetical protein
MHYDFSRTNGFGSLVGGTPNKSLLPTLGAMTRGLS